MANLRGFFSGLLGAGAMVGAAAAADAPGDHSALLRALEDTKFWLAEDYDDRVALSAEVANKGVAALFGSKRLVFLDAEQLAEDGIIDVLFEIGPHLRQRGVTVRSLDVDESDGSSYVVRVNGTVYTVYTPDQAEDSWGFALETFVRIVNDLLPDQTEDRFYAIGGGNDGSGIFLPPEILPYFDAMDPSGRPYVPTRETPWHGMPHDG
jgi:hypothetical protein